jgi:hypothetical protein
MVDPGAALSDLMAVEPFPFLRLLKFTETPRMVGRQGPWRRSASCLPAPEPVAVRMRDQDYWRETIAAAGHKLHSAQFNEDAAALYVDSDSPAYAPVVYLSFRDRLVYVAAFNDKAYAMGREALSGAVSMPRKPQVSHSMAVLAAGSTILEATDGLTLLQERFGEPPAAIQAPTEQAQTAAPDGPVPTMEEAQRIADRLTYNYNEGLQETDQEIGRALRLDPQLVAGIRRALPLTGSADSGRREPDWMGLSPRAVHELIGDPVPAAEGAIVLRKPAGIAASGESAVEAVAQTRVLRFATWLLESAGEGRRIPATKAGYVKPALVKEAADRGLIKTARERARDSFRMMGHTEQQEEEIERIAEILEPKRENDSREFLGLRELLEVAGLIRLDSSFFRVTDQGRRGLQEPVWMYHHLLLTMFRSYEWYLPDYGPALPGLRERAGFLFYALDVLCGVDGAQAGTGYEWVPLGRLTDVFAATLPELAEDLETGSPEDSAGLRALMVSEVLVSFAQRFGERFGLLELRLLPPETRQGGEMPAETGGDGLPAVWVRPTPMLPQVFRIGNARR